MPPPSEVATFESAGLLAWLGCYEMKPIKGAMPTHWDGLGQDSLSQLWVRDKPARRLDFAALSALADVFFPRIFLRRAKRVPAGTVSMTVYFHADASQLEEVGAGYFDDVTTVIQGGSSSVKALTGSTEEEQFH